MIKKFRAFDGESYWYSDEKHFFIKDYQAKTLKEATELDIFSIADLEQYIGKADSKGVLMYENSVIHNPMLDPDKVFQVIWSDQECGFRKVPLGKDQPITKIDEAFMIVLGTIREY